MSLRHAIWSEWTKLWSVRLGGGVAILIGAVLALLPTLFGIDGSNPPQYDHGFCDFADKFVRPILDRS